MITEVGNESGTYGEIDQEVSGKHFIQETIYKSSGSVSMKTIQSPLQYNTSVVSGYLSMIVRLMKKLDLHV